MQISSMFSSRWVATFLVFAWSTCAAQTQNFSGNWHLNVEKSRWGATTKPVAVVVAIDHHGDEIQYHGSVTYANEETRAFGFGGAFDGKPYRMSRSYGDGQITLRRIDISTFDSVFHSDDAQYTETARTTVSRDGKLLTRKLTLQSPEGKKSWTEIYEKR